MNLFQRALRFLFTIIGLIGGTAVSVAIFFARQIIRPDRQPLWGTPGDLGLAYENAFFTAQDGVPLSGWFIPAANPNGSTLIMVHGWPWNRLGDTADNFLANLIGSRPLDLLRLAYNLHQEGFHLLMFDLRNHGESAAAPPVTFGQEEMRDLLGAVSYVSQRPEVNPKRIGAIGFSMGANTVLYALTRTDQIAAAVAVQPTSVSVFAHRLGNHLFGPLSKLVLPIAELCYRLAGGPAFKAIRPGTAVSRAYPTPVLYIQGSGDPWGSAADVAAMAAVTVNATEPIFVESSHRYDGYQYAVENPKLLAAFFEQHLGK